MAQKLDLTVKMCGEGLVSREELAEMLDTTVIDKLALARLFNRNDQESWRNRRMIRQELRKLATFPAAYDLRVKDPEERLVCSGDRRP